MLTSDAQINPNSQGLTIYIIHKSVRNNTTVWQMSHWKNLKLSLHCTRLRKRVLFSSFFIISVFLSFQVLSHIWKLQLWWKYGEIHDLCHLICRWSGSYCGQISGRCKSNLYSMYSHWDTLLFPTATLSPGRLTSTLSSIFILVIPFHSTTNVSRLFPFTTRPACFHCLLTWSE